SSRELRVCDCQEDSKPASPRIAGSRREPVRSIAYEHYYYWRNCARRPRGLSALPVRSVSIYAPPRSNAAAHRCTAHAFGTDGAGASHQRDYAGGCRSDTQRWHWWRGHRPAHYSDWPRTRRSWAARAEHADGDLAGQRLWPLPAQAGSMAGAARSQFPRHWSLSDRCKRRISLPDHSTGRVSLEEPSQCLASGAYPLLGVWPIRAVAPGDADVLSR